VVTFQVVLKYFLLIISGFESENLKNKTPTFSQTESILERFMLRFEELAIDCNDHLVIYDGAHAIGNHKASIPYYV